MDDLYEANPGDRSEREEEGGGGGGGEGKGELSREKDQNAPMAAVRSFGPD